MLYISCYSPRAPGPLLNRSSSSHSQTLAAIRTFEMCITLLQFAFTIWLVALRQTAAQGTQCYYPNGNLAPSHTPCNTSMGFSWCCLSTDVCLSNRLCFQQSETYTNRIGRGSCTDSTWKSDNCPQYCKDGENVVRRCARVLLIAELAVAITFDNTLYLASGSPDGTFCCDANSNSTTGLCQTPTQGSFEPFNLPPGHVISNRTSGSQLLPNFEDQTEPTAPNASTVTTTMTVTATATQTAVTAAVSNSSRVTKVAAGIAAPLSILLLTALAAIGILASKNRKLRQAQHHSYAPVKLAPRDPAPYDRHPPAQQQWTSVAEAPSDRQVLESGGRAVRNELPGQ